MKIQLNRFFFRAESHIPQEIKNPLLFTLLKTFEQASFSLPE